MRTNLYRQAPGSASRSGFTMIEVALSLAIVAFALVAILGVLPSGMQVQKENREDTLINQDGLFLLESIRSGSRGLDDLTDYVESIQQIITSATKSVTNEWVNVTNVNQSTPPGLLANGASIIGLLVQPKVISDGATPPTLTTNTIIARVRSINGSAAEKGSMTNDFAFRYQMQVDVVPVALLPIATNVPSGLSAIDKAIYLDALRKAENEQRNMTNNLYNLRLVLRWPLYQRGNAWVPGRNRKTFNTMVGGRLTDDTGGLFFSPNSYINASL